MNILERVKIHSENYYKKSGYYTPEVVDVDVYQVELVLSQLFVDCTDWQEKKVIQNKLLYLYNFYLNSNPNHSPTQVMCFIITCIKIMKANNLDFTKF